MNKYPERTSLVGGGLLIMTTIGAGLTFSQQPAMPTITPTKKIDRERAIKRALPAGFGGNLTHIDLQRSESEGLVKEMADLARKMVENSRPLDDEISRAIDKNLFDWL